MLTTSFTNIIFSCLKGIDGQNMVQRMQKHYRILQLTDANGNWIDEKLKALEGDLLPIDLTEEKTAAFVHRMALLAEQNPYLINFIQHATTGNFETLSDKIKNEGKAVFPDLIAFAMVLDRMTRNLYGNPELIQICVKHFKRLRLKKDLFNNYDLFFKVKLTSVELSIEKIFVKSYLNGRISKNAGNWSLPLNILEATLTDYFKGNKDNARASLPLIANGPGASQKDSRSGAGPTFLSVDKKGIHFCMPYVLHWTHLYQTWNMAFVSQRPVNSIYLFPKLFIPQVADYTNSPEEYLGKRVLALYLTLYHKGLNGLNDLNDKIEEVDWRNVELTKLWGKCNLESAGHYKSLFTRK